MVWGSKEKNEYAIGQEDAGRCGVGTTGTKAKAGRRSEMRGSSDPTGGNALRAFHVVMFAGQGIFRARVVEAGEELPVLYGRVFFSVFVQLAGY